MSDTSIPGVTSFNIRDAAQTAETTMTEVMQFEPMLAGMIGMFVPGVSAAQPFIVMAMPYIIKALDDIAKGNNGDLLASFLELASHLTKGMPNSPALDPAAPMDSPPSQDPSAQGSG